MHETNGRPVDTFKQKTKNEKNEKQKKLTAVAAEVNVSVGGAAGPAVVAIRTVLAHAVGIVEGVADRAGSTVLAKPVATRAASVQADGGGTGGGLGGKGNRSDGQQGQHYGLSTHGCVRERKK